MRQDLYLLGGGTPSVLFIPEQGASVSGPLNFAAIYYTFGHLPGAASALPIDSASGEICGLGEVPKTPVATVQTASRTRNDEFWAPPEPPDLLLVPRRAQNPSFGLPEH